AAALDGKGYVSRYVGFVVLGASRPRRRLRRLRYAGAERGDRVESRVIAEAAFQDRRLPGDWAGIRLGLSSRGGRAVRVESARNHGRRLVRAGRYFALAGQTPGGIREGIQVDLAETRGNLRNRAP